LILKRQNTHGSAPSHTPSNPHARSTEHG
jgi:hypothetical protein